MDTTIKPISKTINIDLYSPTSYEVIKAQQGDNLSRIIQFVLYNQGKPYTIPENVTIKMEGHRGDNSFFKPKDCTVSQNIISCALDEDILYETGTVEAKIVMYMTNNTILSTIPFKIYVQKNPCDKNKIEKEKSSLINWLIQSVDEHIADNICHITSTERTDWNDAYNNKHTHSNKTVLDNTTASFTTEEKNKLCGIATGAEVNVQSDWNNTNTTSDEYIKNKPTSMPASDVFPWAKAETKPAYTKSEVGLSKVENKSSATIRGELTKQNVIDALGYTPGSADTLVDTIEPNTITANKLMIGDFTNYATVNENFPNSMLPTSAFGGTSISDGYIVKPTATNPYLMLCDYTPCNLKSGEQIYYEMSIKGDVSGDVCVGIYYYDASKNYIVYRRTTHSINTEEQVISGTLTISNTGEMAAYFIICVEQPSSPRSQIYVRKAKFIRKSSGNLIVDGAITTNKLANNSVTAEKININSLSEISSNLGTITNATFNGNVAIDSMGANALVVGRNTAEYVGVFVQNFAQNSLNKFGIYASEAGNTGLFNDVKKHWLIREDKDGNVYIPHRLNVDGGLELHTNTPYIDFHYGSSTQDYTSRIIETSAGVLSIKGSLDSTSFSGAPKPIENATSDSTGYYLGTSSYKWRTIYAYNDTINTSDRNEKHNIDYQVLDHIDEIYDELKPCSYVMNGGERTHFGFIAQDCEEAVQKHGYTLDDLAFICKDHEYVETYDRERGETIETLQYNEDGSPKYIYGLRYSEIVPLNTMQIQKIKKENKELKTQICELQAQVAEIQKTLEQVITQK